MTPGTPIRWGPVAHDGRPLYAGGHGIVLGLGLGGCVRIRGVLLTQAGERSAVLALDAGRVEVLDA